MCSFNSVAKLKTLYFAFPLSLTLFFFFKGVVNVLLTTPLWVVNTRLKLQGAKFRNEDIVPTNYKGIIGKCLLGEFLFKGFLFSLYLEFIVTIMLHKRQPHISASNSKH